MIRSMLQPDLYHGKTPWNQFEGWYTKIVNTDASKAFAFILGVYWGKKLEESHAFLQVVDGTKVDYHYHAFSSDCFQAYDSPFKIMVHDNCLSLEGLSLRVNTSEQNIMGTLKFSNLIKWKDRPLSPGSMGFFNFIPFMQCYSQVCGMDFNISGELSINGTTYNFDGGKGYMEKNWGNSFPYSWIWIQSNHFSNEGTSLSCSIGHIPFWITSFRGFLVGLYHNGIFYEFTTMNGSKINIATNEGDIKILLSNSTYRLVLTTKSDPSTFVLCKGPRNGRMIPLVKESLRGQVSVQLFNRLSGKLIFEDLGVAAGIEYGGEQMNLLDI